MPQELGIFGTSDTSAAPDTQQQRKMRMVGHSGRAPLVRSATIEALQQLRTVEDAYGALSRLLINAQQCDAPKVAALLNILHGQLKAGIDKAEDVCTLELAAAGTAER